MPPALQRLTLKVHLGDPLRPSAARSVASVYRPDWRQLDDHPLAVSVGLRTCRCSPSVAGELVWHIGQCDAFPVLLIPTSYTRLLPPVLQPREVVWRGGAPWPHCTPDGASFGPAGCRLPLVTAVAVQVRRGPCFPDPPYSPSFILRPGHAVPGVLDRCHPPSVERGHRPRGLVDKRCGPSRSPCSRNAHGGRPARVKGMMSPPPRRSGEAVP